MEATRVPGYVPVTIVEVAGPTEAERIPGAQVTITETATGGTAGEAASRFFIAS